MHVVELTFELESQFDFFLVISRVLHVLFFKFQTESLLTLSLLFQLVVIITHCLHILLKDEFVINVLLDTLFELALTHFYVIVVFVCDFGYQNAVVCLAAVLEEDVEHFPDLRNNGKVFARCRQHLLQHFEEANRIDEERSVNTVNFAG